MSGGCCSPLGPGPSTPVFYQTVLDSTGTAKPQEAALKFSADFTETDVPGVATLIAAPGITAAAAAAAAAQTTANTAEADAATAQTTANAAGAAASAAQTTATAAEQPFKGTFYVDPAFAGTSTGSASNPFTTIAAAFAAAVALALPGAIVRIPPGITVTENVVFPGTGGDWEIRTDVNFTASTAGSRITGTVTCDCNSASLSAFRLSGLILNGNLSGACSGAGGAELVLSSVRQIGTISLTKTAGFWVAAFKGQGSPSANKTGGSTSSTASIDGTWLAQSWVFEGGITEGTGTGPFNPSPGSQWRDCQFGALNGSAVSITLNAASLNAAFVDCYSVGPVTFTTLANYVVNVCPATMASLLAQGCTLVGSGSTIKTLDSNVSRISTELNNRASTNLGARAPADLYEMVVSSTLLAQGINGLYQPNAIYTDMTGTLVTVPVGNSLDITAAVGTKASGSLQFQHNGAAAPLAFSTTGIVTPGAVSIALALSVKRRS